MIVDTGSTYCTMIVDLPVHAVAFTCTCTCRSTHPDWKLRTVHVIVHVLSSSGGHVHYTFPAFHTKSASTHTVTVQCTRTACCACSKNIAGRKKVVSGLQENHAVHAPGCLPLEVSPSRHAITFAPETLATCCTGFTWLNGLFTVYVSTSSSTRGVCQRVYHMYPNDC